MDLVDSDNLILTCGATHGLQLLLCGVIAPNGIIFVEEVTYMIALKVFKQFPLMRIVTGKSQMPDMSYCCNDKFCNDEAPTYAHGSDHEQDKLKRGRHQT